MSLVDRACRLTLICVILNYVSGHGNSRDWVKPPTPAEIFATDYVYEINGGSYTGYVAFPKHLDLALSIKGTLLAHQWYGLGEMEKYRCEEIASSLGFLCFALDVYGTGNRARNDAEATEMMDKLVADPSKLRARIQGSLDAMLSLSKIDVSKIGFPFPRLNASAVSANGYCFGGLMVLELARFGGAQVAAVTSFHGEAAVFVHHAELDIQGDNTLRKFEQEMKTQDVAIWSTKYYGQMEHGWTDPSLDVYDPFQGEVVHAGMFSAYRLLFEVNDSSVPANRRHRREREKDFVSEGRRRIRKRFRRQRFSESLSADFRRRLPQEPFD